MDQFSRACDHFGLKSIKKTDVMKFWGTLHLSFFKSSREVVRILYWLVPLVFFYVLCDSGYTGPRFILSSAARVAFLHPKAEHLARERRLP
jgi:hypothetical protein